MFISEILINSRGKKSVKLNFWKIPINLQKVKGRFQFTHCWLINDYSRNTFMRDITQHYA